MQNRGQYDFLWLLSSWGDERSTITPKYVCHVNVKKSIGMSNRL
uniref:Uncharacterized protein n=1 Tax=Rhizophora mucronata TaxID=61149 RepID=A0A2P2N453_RHIMU